MSDHQKFLGRKLKQSNKILIMNPVNGVTGSGAESVMETPEDRRLKEVAKFDVILSLMIIKNDVVHFCR